VERKRLTKLRSAVVEDRALHEWLRIVPTVSLSNPELTKEKLCGFPKLANGSALISNSSMSAYQVLRTFLMLMRFWNGTGPDRGRIAE